MLLHLLLGFVYISGETANTQSCSLLSMLNSMPLPAPRLLLPSPALLRLRSCPELGQCLQRCAACRCVVRIAPLPASHALQARQPLHMRRLQLPVLRPLLQQLKVPAAERSREQHGRRLQHHT
jgi:hypothetical protein